MMLTPKLEAERLTCTDRFSFFLLVGNKNKNSLYSTILFIVNKYGYYIRLTEAAAKKKKKKSLGPLHSLRSRRKEGN